MKIDKVVSLFDGAACGLQALKEASVDVGEYHAFEIDKYAMQIAKKNHPEIIHHGSVVGADFKQFKGADLLIGGSPCQGFSMAGKQLAFNDERSKLFFEFVRAKEEIEPKYFLLENVVMKKKYEAAISQLMGCYPTLINSALVSAQNRQRLYWCNWNVRQPEDGGIYLKDIIENDVDNKYYLSDTLLKYFTESKGDFKFKPHTTKTKKSFCLTARYYKMGRTDPYIICAQRGRKINGKTKQQLEIQKEQKTNTITSVQKDNLLIKIGNISDGDYQGNRVYSSFGKGAALTTRGSKDNYAITDSIRKLTPIECERLQTMPDNYTEGVSNTQRYHMLGNGWTVAVISHIFRELYFNQENTINCNPHHQQTLF